MQTLSALLKKIEFEQTCNKSLAYNNEKIFSETILGSQNTNPPPPNRKHIVVFCWPTNFPIYYRKESVKEIGIKSVECVTYRANILYIYASCIHKLNI